MKRSGGVTAAGVVLVAGSALLLLLALATVVMILFVAPKTTAAQNPLQPGIAILGGVFYLALAGWGIATAVGIFRLRPWARISIFTMSVLAVVGCILALVSILILLPVLAVPRGPQVTSMLRVVMIVTLGTPGVVAAWWLVLFTRPGVKQQFMSREAAPPAGAPATTPGGARPLSITVIAIWLLVSALAMPWVLYATWPTRPAAMPTLVFGAAIFGWKATAWSLALLAADITLGLGLWWLKPWARVGAIIYCVFSMVNMFALALRPDAFARVFGTMKSANPALASFAIPRTFLWVLALLSAALAAVALRFLIKSKTAFASPLTAPGGVAE